MEDKIIHDNKGNWMHKSMADAMQKIHDNRIKAILFMSGVLRTKDGKSYNPNITEVLKYRNEKNEDNRKWAWIKRANTRMMVWVDNKTMKAYKSDGYDKTWMEIKKFTFERWCTGFDL